jgi:GDPmannose 4,6-dehydratase
MLNQTEPKEYLLASGKTYTVKEFIEKAFNIAGIYGEWKGEELNEQFILKKTLNSIYYDNQILVEINEKFYRPAEVDLLLGDPSLAKKELNWNQEISFDSLVEEMVKEDLLNLKV